MSLLADGEDRSIEASPARRLRAIESGQGPRAPWMASVAGGLLALGLLSVAAAPLALGARGWLRDALRVQTTGDGLSPRGTLVPALVAVALVLTASIVGHALAHGGWVRVGAWRRPGKTPALQRIRAALGGWLLALAALAGGLVGASPWVASLTELSRRPLEDGLWALAAFVASAALGALLGAAAIALAQMRLAMRAFDRTLRMTRAEAREAAREDLPASRRGPTTRSRWRFA